MDSTEPIPADEPAPAEPPETAPEAEPSAARRVRRKLHESEDFVAWGRAWLSRDGRMHWLLAARTLDFVVLTHTHLLVFSTGFFSRRPRRRVYEMPLDRLFAEERKASRGRCLAIWTKGRRPLLFEFRSRPRNDLADLVLDQVHRNEEDMKMPPVPPPTPE